MKQETIYCVTRSLALAVLLLAASGCATLFDAAINRTTIDPPYAVSGATTAVHDQLTIVDLHADPLLWKRDLLERHSYGHVDLPRLQEGKTALQVFGVVTGVPFPIGLENNRDGNDLITLLTAFQSLPDEVQKSRLQRALYQAGKLRQSIDASRQALMPIRTRRDLAELLSLRSQGRPVIGALLSLEGAHALEGDVANLDRLYDAGFRMLGLAHHFDNDMAGSAHGVDKYGLTDKGRVLVQRALQLGMIVDLAHASEKTIDDVIAMADRPVVASHTGVRATCDTARNLADRHIQAIARAGGVIGIGIYELATCGKTMRDTVRAVRHVVNLVGIEHVALGTDFDGSTEVMVDATGLPLLTEALLADGFTLAQIKAMMGENALRVFRQALLH
jgi:microsomal dipeptidase-like Zn-dependent dipeptidase